MNRWRTHHCGQLTEKNIGDDVTLIGWLHNKRNLGSLLFLDLRDNYGLTQIVLHENQSFFESAKNTRVESVIQVTGHVRAREGGINSKLSTGKIEIIAEVFHIESTSEILPFPISHNTKQEGEETRLTYRYLDLRTEKMHFNILFRSKVIKYIRDKMFELGFYEFNTPILTSSSPEGARDFVVPSRLHPGKFYALPQAPQQFKQLLMCSGFDKYFQIAPCFRDEDPRADRAPGEFYQLDVEMCFVTQDEVFDVMENLIQGLFQNKEFSSKKIISLEKFDPSYQKKNRIFPCIPWKTSMENYGNDKPDLRFDLPMISVYEIFQNSTVPFFQDAYQKQHLIRALQIPKGGQQSRKFFDDLQNTAKNLGLAGLPWVSFKDNEWKGSVAKILTSEEKENLKSCFALQNDDALIFIMGENKSQTLSMGGKLRVEIAKQLHLIPADVWAFAWIVDFPMFEWNEEDQKIDFSHNPFSMPQGGLSVMATKNPLEILAFQYDLVCNGIELCSGAIRNHRRDIMKKAFEIAGYSEQDLENKFGALWNAFSYGAPPHGGMAPGIDRMIMLLLDEPNIREVIAFPLNQKAQDLLMNAPSEISAKQMKDVHVRIKE